MIKTKYFCDRCGKEMTLPEYEDAEKIEYNKMCRECSEGYYKWYASGVKRND